MNISFDTPTKLELQGFITDLLKTEMIAKDSIALSAALKDDNQVVASSQKRHPRG